MCIRDRLMTVTTLKFSNSNNQNNYKLESLGIIRTNEEMILRVIVTTRKKSKTNYQ